MIDLLERLDEQERERLVAAAHPRWREPVLARLTDQRFSDPEWRFERKFDGERALAFRQRDRVRLLSRNRKALSGSYPELVDALVGQRCDDCVVDGEVVAFDGQRSSFSRLQRRMQIVAKRASAAYESGRSSDWLKFKRGSGQELVIAGFSPPRGSRRGFGALLLGYYEDHRLRYAGKVGTGFDDRTLTALREQLEGLARTDSPFFDEVRDPSVTFVQPRLVAEIGFTEWTADGRLRHPRFLGLRRDKRPEEVGREQLEA